MTKLKAEKEAVDPATGSRSAASIQPSKMPRVMQMTQVIDVAVLWNQAEGTQLEKIATILLSIPHSRG